MKDFFWRLYNAASNLFAVGLVILLLVTASFICVNTSPVTTASAASESWTPQQQVQVDQILARRQAVAWEDAGRAWADADWPKVINALEEVTSADPTNPFVGEKIFSAHLNYGVQLHQKDLFPEAKAEFNAAAMLAGDDKGRKDLATAAVADVDKLLRQNVAAPAAKEAAKGPMKMAGSFYAGGQVTDYTGKNVSVLFRVGPSTISVSAPKMRTSAEILGGMQGPAKWNLIDRRRDTWRASAPNGGIYAGTFLRLEVASGGNLLLTNIQTGEQWIVSNPVFVAGGDFWWDGKNWWTTAWPSGFFN